MKYNISASEVVYYNDIIEADSFEEALKELNDKMSTVGLTEVDVNGFKITNIEEIHNEK